MKKNRLIFYTIFGIYNIAAFIFAIALPNIMFNIVGYVPYFKYLALFGLILMIVDFAWAWKINKESAKDLEARETELNILKAKLFDLQEAAKK